MNFAKAPHMVANENIANVYSTSPYSSSLPSPPYSEENYNGNDEKDANDRISFQPYSTSGWLDNESGSSFNNKLNPSKSPLTKLNKQQKNVFGKTVPTHLKKIYPNLLKGVIGDTEKKKGKRHKTSSRGSPQKKPGSPQKKPKLICHICEKHVATPDIKRHLYFGPVKCLRCGWTEEYCPNFSSFHLAPKIRSGCQHSNLKWISNPIDTLKKPLGCNNKDVTDLSFLKKLENYLQLLRPLRELRPWSKAFVACNSLINSSASSESLATYIDNVEENEMVPKEEEEEEKLPIETIDLPDGEFYLILKNAIEECPNCYEKLNPNDLSFNIETWLINVICKFCSLKIYFVLPPPDGSEPKIKILHES